MTGFWKNILPAPIYNRIRAAIVFRPDDPNNLFQMLPPRQVPVDVERIKGYRYPAPGSRGGARVPLRVTSDRVYDIKQFTRDPRNLPKDSENMINAGKNVTSVFTPKAIEAGSVGNTKHPAVSRYDPSGLRTSMTASWPELNKALAVEASPDHLPMPEWWPKLKEIEAECEAKGIPYVEGRRYRYAKTSNYTEERW